MSRAFLNRINRRKPTWDAEDEADRSAPETPCKHAAGEDCPTCGPATQRKPAAAPLVAILSVRARVGRTCGASQTVRFSSDLEEEPFTLRATTAQARALAVMLNHEVEIEARVARDAAGAIERGTLESYEPVHEGDPRPAWRRWYGDVATQKGGAK